MARPLSTVETHPNRNAIISRILAGDSLKSIGAEFNLTQPTLSRFKQRVVVAVTKRSSSAEISAVTSANDESAEMSAHPRKSDVNREATSITVRSILERRMKLVERAMSQVAPDEKSRINLEDFATVAGVDHKYLSLFADVTGERQVQQAAGPSIVMIVPRGTSEEAVPRVDLSDEGGETIESA